VYALLVLVVEVLKVCKTTFTLYTSKMGDMHMKPRVRSRSPRSQPQCLHFMIAVSKGLVRKSETADICTAVKSATEIENIRLIPLHDDSCEYGLISIEDRSVQKKAQALADLGDQILDLTNTPEIRICIPESAVVVLANRKAHTVKELSDRLGIDIIIEPAVKGLKERLVKVCGKSASTILSGAREVYGLLSTNRRRTPSPEQYARPVPPPNVSY
jgi:hypothetical protein